jgi:hypothetical protein
MPALAEKRAVSTPVGDPRAVGCVAACASTAAGALIRATRQTSLQSRCLERYIRSKTPAAPMPVPMHIVTIP